MKKFLTVFLLTAILTLTACGKSTQNSAELAKIPEEFPVHNAPICNIAEFISYTDKSAADQYYAEVVYNSSSEYEDIIEYYQNAFPDAICTDFGVAYNFVNVMPIGEGHLVSVRIYSSLISGENGLCTVTITALEQ